MQNEAQLELIRKYDPVPCVWYLRIVLPIML